MTRRRFLRSAFASAFAFAVLPPATIYQRIWRATLVPNVERIAGNFAGYFTWEVNGVELFPSAMPPPVGVPLLRYALSPSGLWVRSEGKAMLVVKTSLPLTAPLAPPPKTCPRSCAPAAAP